MESNISLGGTMFCSLSLRKNMYMLDMKKQSVTANLYSLSALKMFVRQIYSIVQKGHKTTAEHRDYFFHFLLFSKSTLNMSRWVG